MSDSALGYWLSKAFLPEMEKLSGKEGRKEIERHGTFSVLVIQPKIIKDGIDKYARESLGQGRAKGSYKLTKAEQQKYYLSNEVKNKLVKNYINHLEGIEKKIISGTRVNLTQAEADLLKNNAELKAKIKNKKQKAKIFISVKYESLRGVKRKALTAPMVEEYRKILSKSNANKVQEMTTNQSLFKKHKVGWDVGHGEFGESASEIKAAKLKKMAYDRFDANSDERAKLDQMFLTYEKIAKTKIKHDLIVDDNGNIKESYVVTMSMQDAKGNSLDASAEEGPGIRSISNTAQELIESEGSYSTSQAIHRVILSRLTQQALVLPNVTYKGITPLKKYKSKGRANKTGRVKAKKKITLMQEENPIAGAEVVKIDAKRRPEPSNISLINLINKRLPKELINNMGSPALENITGRFANSVRALKISQSGRGLPNIQYTYDHDPYSVFEMGGRGDKRWATKDRDPRTIIDKSIREVAAEMALGKFTTTRL